MSAAAHHEAAAAKAYPARRWAHADHSSSRAVEFALRVLDNPSPATSLIDVRGLLYACSELVYRITGERVTPACTDMANAAKAQAANQVSLPAEFLCSSELCMLSPHATKLLFNMAGQIASGENKNGEVDATESRLQTLGWGSSSQTKQNAMAELMAAKMVVRTRQGSRRKKHLYALTMLPGCGDSFGAWSQGMPAPKDANLKWTGVRVGEKDKVTA